MKSRAKFRTAYLCNKYFMTFQYSPKYNNYMKKRILLAVVTILSGMSMVSPCYSQLQPKKLPSKVGNLGTPTTSNEDPLSSPTVPGSSSSSDMLNGPGVQKFTSAVGEVVGDVTRSALEGMREWGEDSKRVDITVSYDASIEGPALGVQYRTPLFFGVFARAGYNLKYDEMKGNIKKFRWNAGLQFWLKNWDILELSVGETYYKKLEDVSYGLGLSTGYSQKIYKGLGVEGSLGAALSFKTDVDGDPYFKFIWHVGLVYRIVLD